MIVISNRFILLEKLERNFFITNFKYNILIKYYELSKQIKKLCESCMSDDWNII